MTSYVDVDLSEEALQEDVELQEAVENMVTKGAEAIITDVKNDVSGVYEQMKDFFGGLFPFIVYWSEDRTLFWIDMQHSIIIIVLFVFFFWFLSPWQESSSSSRNHYYRKARGKNRNHNLHRNRTLNQGMKFRFSLPNFSLFWYTNKTNRRRSLERSKSTSCILKYSVQQQNNALSRQNSGIGGDEMEDDLLEDEESESEVHKFAKRWPSILKSSPYRCLVLPPGCKRVDKPSNNSHRKEQGAKENPKNDNTMNTSKTTTTADDNPSTRLVNYMKHIVHLFMLFRFLNFEGAGWTLIHWVQAAINTRNSNDKRGQGREQGVEEDEDEDESVASGSVVMMSSSNINTADDEIDSVSSYLPTNNGTTATVGSRRLSRDYETSVNVHHHSMNNMPQRILRSKKEKFSKIRGNTTSSNYQCSRNENCSGEEQEMLNKTTVISNGLEQRNIQLQNIEKKDHDLLYDDETLTKTPPRASLRLDYQHYSTPTIDGRITPPLRSSPQSSVATTSSKIVPMAPRTSLSTIKPHLNSNGINTRDALENYRDLSSLRRIHLNSTPRVSLSDNKVSSPLLDHTKPFFFETVGSQESLRRMAVEIPVPDKNGYMVGDEFLPDKSFTPLLVFVNSRSGPQQGHLLTTQLRGLLNPIQIWDLADGGPEKILDCFSAFSRLRILVCGGDGTVSWIVSTIDNMKLHRWPPIAILPLGTGNDLARIHGWGGGYNNESLIKILVQVSEGYVSWLDRWEMTIENRKGKIKNVKSFLNYFSVGADAQTALQVHMMRESRPQLFFSRIVNKAWYGIFGAEEFIKATSMNIRNDITLIADGVEVPLPADSQGIIILNIDSHSGGVPLWSMGHNAFDSERNEVENDSENDFGAVPIKRSKSMDDAFDTTRLSTSNSSGAQNQYPPTALNRADSVEDIASQALTDDEKYTRVTACDLPSSCQDGLLDIVSVRGTFHLGQIRVGLSTAQKLCQCREATIIIKRQVSVQIDGEPWRQNVCTLRIRRKKNAAIMIHRSADESNGIESEMANLLDWASNRHLIDGKVHEALMKEFSRRIESKTRQRRVQSNDNLMTHLKRAINNANISNNHNNSINIGGGNATGIGF
mmetsp:Transcript_33369/g.37227  ORF Transcript_33369/g.37227 Transcript_33369/m.37227 type:complete len:1098 (+) Transcript_33369:235-3528(+)